MLHRSRFNDFHKGDGTGPRNDFSVSRELNWLYEAKCGRERTPQRARRRSFIIAGRIPAEAGKWLATMSLELSGYRPDGAISTEDCKRRKA